MKTYTKLVAGLVFTIGSFGAVRTLMATPDDSQRLRGLEGRIFGVQVYNLTTGEDPFQNCYYFLEDGVWFDPPFGMPGTWVQHTNGASTTYTAEALLDVPDFGIYLELVQEGAVTPAQGMGNLQFEAITNVTGVLFGEEFNQEFYSVGFQNNDCVPPPP